MKSLYKPYLIALIIIVGSFLHLHAQICVNTTLTLEPDGTAILEADPILNFDLQPDQSAFVLPAYFTCENVNESTPVTVYLIDNGDTVYLCTQEVIVEDAQPPIARCTSNIHVQLNWNGAYRFLFTDADDGSYDECTEVRNHKFIPETITCSDPNPMNVMMVVRDLSANEDTCIFTVTYDNYTGPIDPIECIDTVTYYFWGNEPYPIYVRAKDILSRGQRGCIDNYSVDLYNGVNFKTEDIFILDDTMSLWQVILTELESGEQCTTQVVLKVADDPCEAAAFICDTSCHSTPIGDCASGHSDEDAIELPCDVYITDWCVESAFYPDPDFIEWYGYPESENAWPTVGNEFLTIDNNVDNLFLGYWDQVIITSTGQQIKRNWSIVDWCAQHVIDYQQNIYILYDLTEICDTLPWNAPIGDCQSGHTLSDDVEWPADITIHSLFAHPNDLAVNPEVQSQNVRPQLNRDCALNAFAFQDSVSEVNDTTLRIERKWSVIDWTSVEIWDFKQIITIIHTGIKSTVCVTTEGGDPISNVELIPGVLTDNSGCHPFAEHDGIIVTPVKDSPFEEGVNILDYIMLMEDLLDFRSLSKYQKYAADVNNSSNVSVIDAIELNKFLRGIFSPTWTHAWRFFEQNTGDGFVDISDPLKTYKFIGVKMGDLDNSYLLNYNYEDILLRSEDDVLNAGETYTIPMYLERNEKLAGMAVQLKNENNNLDFLNVIAPNLPGFDPALNVIHQSDGITIQWVSPAPQLIQGVEVDSTDALFILEIRANENIILNEHLSLEATFDNVLKPSGIDPPLDIRLAWEDVVINSVVEFDNGRRIEFYPNPVKEILYLKGLMNDEKGKITILDPTGRIAFEDELKSSMDISLLRAGVYYVVISVEGKKSRAIPLVKF